MRKKTLSFGDTQIEIAELNTAQVEELTAFQAPEEDPVAAWKQRMWRTILLGVNNALRPPTRENPLGSDSDPKSAADYDFALGYQSANDLHREVLTLSGLRTRAEGESKATVDRSTSASSTAA